MRPQGCLLAAELLPQRVGPLPQREQAKNVHC